MVAAARLDASAALIFAGGLSYTYDADVAVGMRKEMPFRVEAAVSCAILSWEPTALAPQHAFSSRSISYFRLALSVYPLDSLSSLLTFTMFSPPAFPLGLLLLSLGLSGTDARATPHPSSIEPVARTISVSRRSNVQRSTDDALTWLEQNRLATHRKYGVGSSGNQKRASGQNLYVRDSRPRK